MNKKSQQGIALIWIIIAGALLITGVGIATSKRTAEPQPSPSPTPLPSLLPSPTPLLTLQLPSSPQPAQGDIYQQEPLLKILPQKERAELESAIREAQQVLKNIEVFSFTPPSIDDITKGLGQINKQTNEQIQKNVEKQQQEFQQKYQQEIDIDEMMESLNQNPPALPHENKELPPEAQEYYYRKYILKDPAFQY